MTSVSAPGRTSPVLWIGLAVVAGIIFLIAFATREQPELGGFADPEGTGPEGLRALRLMVEESGGSAETDVAFPDSDADVALLATRAYDDFFAAVEGRESEAVERIAPVLDWVEAGGTLISSVDVEGGPRAGTRFFDEADSPRGTCSIDRLDGVETIRPLEHLRVELEPGDEGCFGDGEQAVVVRRTLGSGEIVRLGTMAVFFNRALDDADNGALAARLMRLGDERSVVFLSGPVGAGGTSPIDGPVNDEGVPVGAGDEGVFDLIPARVIALIVGLAGAVLIYALARGRRLGSPVVEPLPIELPSSSFVEALGRLYGRAEAPRSRTARILRDDFRHEAARRLGMPAEQPTEDLARALSLTSGEPADRLYGLLDGREPQSSDALVDLAGRLSEHRDRLTGADYGARRRMTGPAVDSDRTTS